MRVAEVVPRNRISGFLREEEVASAPCAHPAVQPFRLSLVDGELEIDGQRARVPVGVGKFLTGAQVKALFAKYAGLLLFFKSGKSWQRVGDKDVVELREDTVLRTERPVVRTSPRFSAD